MRKLTGEVRKCLQCSKDFYRSRAALKKGGKYCGLDCSRIAHQGSLDLAEAFWMKVDKTSSPTGCWLYTGFTKWDGYGWLARKSNGKTRYMTAHRYAWILTHGEPADGLHIMHQCDNPPCCNPAHLKLGTHQENMADMVAKGRGNSGKADKQKLWPDRVRPVKEAA